MGLGKTVQTLALIEALPGTALVVCPSSLVWNWKSEVAHFLPDLPVLVLDGPDREKRFADVFAHCLVVTSYALLRRDIERYKGMTFSAVVLDEAQHIKNPDSQNARAACTLNAQSRFILTGTPLENSLRDLWSLFEFLLPGYLGSRRDFKDRYETPLFNGERGPLWSRLARRVCPYLMRRRKQEILSELPDKIEQVLEVELSPEQKAAYTELQLAARAQIDQLRCIYTTCQQQDLVKWENSFLQPEEESLQRIEFHPGAKISPRKRRLAASRGNNSRQVYSSTPAKGSYLELGKGSHLFRRSYQTNISGAACHRRPAPHHAPTSGHGMERERANRSQEAGPNPTCAIALRRSILEFRIPRRNGPSPIMKHKNASKKRGHTLCAGP